MQIGPYTIERELGRGGMGAVYLGRRAHDPLPYAIKVIHADLALDPDLAARFEREGAVLERLDHPGLVGLHARGTYRGGLWLALEFVHGASLDERLKSQGPYSSRAAGELLVSLCAGLAHAHRAGVLHRDLKPANILLRALDGQALIADFGLALPLDVSQHLTNTGEVLGSPGFLAPEQCGGGQPCTPATDVYGLGGVLYAALTGEAPIKGSSVLVTLDGVLNTPPRPPSELAPGVDPRLEAICLRCLAKDPSERYADALELQAALVHEPPPRGQRRQEFLVGSGLVVAALGLGAAYALRGFGSAPEAASGSPTQAATPSPATRAPSLSAGIAAAIRAGAWERGRVLCGDRLDAAACWSRYELLAAELEQSGNESLAWRSARDRALELARAAVEAQGTSPTPGVAALPAAIASLSDQALGERISPQGLGDLLEALDEALSEASELAPAQRRALLASRAEVSTRLVRGEGREVGPREAALARISEWEAAGGTPWRVWLLRARIERGLQDVRGGVEALALGEAAARAAGHPWARLAFYSERAWREGGDRPERWDHLWLSNYVLADPAAPASLRFRAALRVASYLGEHGQPAQALKLLDEQSPPPGTARGLVLAAAATRAQVLIELGRSGEAAKLLSLHSAQGELSPRCLLLASIAHRRLGDAEAARGYFGSAKVQDPRDLDLAVRAGLLIGDERLIGPALKQVSATQSVILYWRALATLSRVESERDFEGELLVKADLLERVATPLAKALLSSPLATAGALIERGDWEEAISLLERYNRPQGLSAEELDPICLMACGVLLRAREDEETTSPRWRDAQGRVLNLLRARTAPGVARERLQAAVSALGRPPEEDLPGIQVTLLEAIQAWPEVPAFHWAYVRLLQDWRSWPGSRRILDQDLLKAGRRWGEKLPRGQRSEQDQIQSQFTIAQVPGHPASRQILQRLSNLRADKLQANLRRAIYRRTIKARTQARSISAADATWSLDLLANEAGSLRAERRSLLLDAARILPPTQGNAHRLLALLDRIEAWCGLGADYAERATYFRLKSAAHEVLGEAQAASEEAQRLLPLLDHLRREDRAPALAQIGRTEFLRGEEKKGRARIQGAVDLLPSPGVYLSQARSSEGEARRRAYVRTLTFSLGAGWPKALIAEIEGARLSVEELLREALVELEARDTQNTCGATFAEHLFDADPTPGRALFLWETRLRGNRASWRRAQGLTQAAKDRLRRAKLLLKPRVAAFVTSLEEVSAVEARIFANQGEGALAETSSLVSQLAKLGAEDRDLADRLRVPVLENQVLRDLSALVGAQERAALVRQAGQVFEAWSSRKHVAGRLPVWIAFDQRQGARFQEAIRTLKAGLETPAGKLPLVKARMLVELAVNLSLLGEEEEALKASRRTRTLALELPERARAWGLVAEIQLRAGRLSKAASASRQAFVLCPLEDRRLRLWHQVLWARVKVAQGELERAEKVAESLMGLADKLDRVLAAEVLVLRAELLLKRSEGSEGGEWSAAREVAARAVRLDPGSAEALLALSASLVGEGRLPEAARGLAAAAKSGDFCPRDRERLKLAQEALRDQAGQPQGD